MPPTSRRPPTTEIGRSTTNASLGGGLLPWAALIDDREYAPDVQWPKSVQTFARMQTDAQLKGLLLAISLPIRRFRWEIDPGQARPEVAAHVAESLHLPVRGQDAETISGRRRRFSHDRHLTHALRALAFGHFFFEQVYEYRDPAEGGDGLVHLRKLATRPPRTIAEIALDDDGGLKGIKQNVSGSLLVLDKLLGVERLLAYIWDPDDDGDWTGRSLLRACFRNWLVKDRLIRVDATKHERNGMGVPWFEVNPAASEAQIAELAEVARAMRAGEESGAAGPAKLHLKGVDGTLPDTVASIREHDHQMARAFLAMFFELGTSETGSRSLGAEFIDFHYESLGATADWYRDVVQDHQIRDEVDFNWGEDEAAPLLAYAREESHEFTMEELAFAVDKGLIAVDPELSEHIVQRWHLPRGAALERAPEPAPAPAPEPTKARRRPVRAAGLSLPDRELRRQPYEQEVVAQVDFAAAEEVFTAARDDLVEVVREAQAEQIDALVEAVEAHAGDAPALAALEVDPIDASLIASRLREAGQQGVEAARAEHAAQVAEGAQASVRAASEPDEDVVDEQADERAEAIALLLAAALAGAASRRAAAVARLDAGDAGAAVRGHLEGLSDAFLAEQLGGATWEAFNTGRREFMRANDPKLVYASELLDSNTCSPCTGIDGTEWPSVEAAEGAAYPQGGYIFCEGGLRCRGMLVATY